MEHNWQIERTVGYWFFNSRNFITYTETTFWYCSLTMDRKEISRHQEIGDGQQYLLDDWAKVITTHNKQLDYDR